MFRPRGGKGLLLLQWLEFSRTFATSEPNLKGFSNLFFLIKNSALLFILCTQVLVDSGHLSHPLASLLKNPKVLQDSTFGINFENQLKI